MYNGKGYLCTYLHYLDIYRIKVLNLKIFALLAKNLKYVIPLGTSCRETFIFITLEVKPL